MELLIIILVLIACPSLVTLIFIVPSIAIQEHLENNKIKKEIKKIPRSQRQACLKDLRALSNNYNIVNRKNYRSEMERNETINAIVGDMATLSTFSETKEERIKRLYGIDVSEATIHDYISCLENL